MCGANEQVWLSHCHHPVTPGSSIFPVHKLFSVVVVLFAVSSNCLAECNSCSRVNRKYLQPHVCYYDANTTRF